MKRQMGAALSFAFFLTDCSGVKVKTGDDANQPVPCAAQHKGESSDFSKCTPLTAPENTSPNYALPGGAPEKFSAPATCPRLDQ